MMVSQNAYIFTEYKEKIYQEAVTQSKKIDILEELNELGEISKELEEKINDENDIKVLKSWFKLILKCESIEEFEEKIKSNIE